MKVDAKRKIAVGKEIMTIAIHENPWDRNDAVCIITDPRYPDKKRIESLEELCFILGELEYELEQLC